MGVLDRPAVARDAGPDAVGVAVETQLDEPRVVEQPRDRRRQRAELQPVAGVQGRRRGAVFGARAEVAGTEDDRGEGVHRIHPQRSPPGQPHLDRRAGGQVRAVQAGRQRRRIVGHQQVAGAQPAGEV